MVGVCADVVALAAAVTELLKHTRRARTALWCAVQMTSGECASGPPRLTDVNTLDVASPRHSATLLVTDNWRSPALAASQPQMK